MVEFNYNNEVVSSPTVIVSGRTHVLKGIIQFVNNGNKVYPPLVFEVNNGQFKAILHVSPGEPNNYDVNVYDSGYIDWQGFARDLRNVADRGSLTLHYNELPENKPIHFCVILGRDSDGRYDMPKYKLQRGEVANLDTAIQRLKVAGRLMQAFTQDEFHRLGLSNRTFPFVEESTHSQRVFGYDLDSTVPHNEVKIHVIRSPKTVEELRNPDYAQQNPDAKDNGFLFSHAIDLVYNSDMIKPYRERNTPIQCAVMYLDSTWNGRYITTHAALGGGTGEVKMAVFGSHGLHSYPLNFLQVGPGFVDDTRLSKDEVANDCDQCSTSWECFNICLGAQMHEIGHLLGSPHQTDGVMLRDYIWWNRLFMTREAYCDRDKSTEQIIGSNGEFAQTCHWNIRDIIRYFHHDSFTIPVDKNDPGFGKIHDTYMNPTDLGPIPSIFIIEPGVVSVRSQSGVFMVELVGDDLARYHIAYYPKSYGGNGLQHELYFNFDELNHHFHKSWDQASDNFSIRIMSCAGDLYIDNFKNSCYPSQDSVIRSDFGLGRGVIDGYKGQLLGSPNGDMSFIGVDFSRVYKVRIHHGDALDGITFFMSEGTGSLQPPVPKRNYLHKLVGGSKEQNFMSNVASGEVTVGRTSGQSTDFDLQPGERVSKLHFRSGQWIDAVQVETDNGRTSPMCGNVNGGLLATLAAPTPLHQIIGFYAYAGQWLDGIGVIYTS